MMTPPLSISASPIFKRKLVLLPLFSDMIFLRSPGHAYHGGWSPLRLAGTTPMPLPDISQWRETQALRVQLAFATRLFYPL